MVKLVRSTKPVVPRMKENIILAAELGTAQRNAYNFVSALKLSIITEKSYDVI